MNSKLSTMTNPKSNPKQAWVAQTLRSLEGSTRPAPSPWLYQQVRQRLAARQAAAATGVPDRNWVRVRVAFAAALALANVVTLVHRADFTALSPTPATAEYSYPTLAVGY